MEDNKQSLADKLNNLIKISVIAGILLISLSVSYYIVIFLPQQERAKLISIKQKEEEGKQKEKVRKASLALCLNRAEADYRSLQRTNGKGKMLSMPLDLSNALDKRYKDARDDCYKEYSSERAVQ